MTNRIFLVLLTMTIPGKGAMLPSCVEICDDARWQKEDDNKRIRLGGSCLYLADHYDQLAVPDLSTDDEIHLSITIFSISNINIKEGMYDVEMRVRMHWLDNRIRACQCTDRGNRKGIHLSEDVGERIWVPDLVLVDDLHTKYELSAAAIGGLFMVSHDRGVGVYYDIRVDAVVGCDFDVAWSPFDSNICPLRLASRVPKSKMKIIMNKLPELKINSTGQYKLEPVSLCASETKKCIPQSKYSAGEGQCVGAAVSIIRNDKYSIVVQYTAIITVMTIMTTFTVILPDNDRLGPIGITLLGALTVYYSVSGSDENSALWNPLIVLVMGGYFICYSSVFQLILLLIRGRRQADKVDLIFLAVGMGSAVLLPVVGWVAGYVLAGSVCEGEGVCYHNRPKCYM